MVSPSRYDEMFLLARRRKDQRNGGSGPGQDARTLGLCRTGRSDASSPDSSQLELHGRFFTVVRH